MYIEQLYTGCLAEAAYYIESDGQAAVVDPIRDVDAYIELAKRRGAEIKYIFETHFHADFVSGHIELASKTGATIVYGPGAVAKYDIYNAHDGEEFKLGAITIKALHTPGHTPESTCYLVHSSEGKAEAVFTGDTLFVGDVGRPDLLEGIGISRIDQVTNLYNTISTIIKALPDDVVVYPAHGPGSMCGKSIGKEKQSTIGQEKKNNYALRDMSLEEFADTIMQGQHAAPQYFIQNAVINRTGYESLDSVMQRNMRALSVGDVQSEREAGALVLDTRSADAFGSGFIPGALNIGIDGSFAIWVGTIVNIRQRLIVVADAGREREAVLRLARVGFENVAGYVEGGVDAWQQAGMEVDTVPSVTAAEFADAVTGGHAEVIDVRRPDEYGTAHVKGAINLPLRDLESQLGGLQADTEYFVHCAGGYRSMVAASILKAHGISHVTNVLGGFDVIRTTALPIEEAEEIAA